MSPLDLLLATDSGKYDHLLERIISSRNCHLRRCRLVDQLDEEVAAACPSILFVHLREDDPQACLDGFLARREALGVESVHTLLLAEEANLQVPEGLTLLPLPVEHDDLLGFVDEYLKQHMTILVADDEPLIRRMFRVYLENEGYNVLTAANGHEALAVVRDRMPDLVITDIKMPKADGYQVCRSLKETKETQHIPVIIVSALGSDIDVEKGFNAGANEYLTKPIDLTELSSRIDNLLQGIQLRGRERLLVVVPSPIERSMLEYGLSQQGFEVSSAGTGEDALRLAQEMPPSILISDLELPGLNVFDLQEELKAHETTSHVPLVVVTSRSTKLDRKRRNQLDAAAYLTKPYPIEKMVAIIERMLGERRTKIELEREMLVWTIASLVHALEARDRYTRGHSENVARYAEQIARRFFTSTEKVREIRLGSLLHDIGKIGIRDDVLLKPGRLTEEEYEIIKSHPSKGAEILKPIASLKNIIPIVRWHHERIDGKGYPDGLAGEDIPLNARIVAVADTFDALTSDRPYRKRLPLEEALAEVERVAGTQLDEEVVQAFLHIHAEEGVQMPEPGSSSPVLAPLQP